MRSNLAIVEIDEDQHVFETHATMIRGALNQWCCDMELTRTLRSFDRIICLFATLKTPSCWHKPPESGWGRVIWDHLLAMADLKSHDAALVEARSIREQFTHWPVVLSA
jgi:hypothetical protein